MIKLKINAEKTLVRVSRLSASVGGTSAKLKEGDIISIKNLFYGLMLPSGNDAAYCLAETFG
jgi:serine-type D-Ala-D-Ala carboxypeptidase (penicillin-binding protein 5/6)